MNPKIIPWIIEIKDLMTLLRVGNLDHERAPQPVSICISICATTPIIPQSIDDCLNYQPICRWIVDQWPMQPHASFLEIKAHELMSFIFDFDARTESVDVAISKGNAMPGTSDAQIRIKKSRVEYDLFRTHFINTHKVRA